MASNQNQKENENEKEKAKAKECVLALSVTGQLATCAACPPVLPPPLLSVLPPLIAPLGWLLGSWSSSAADGHFPTIEPFKYNDHLHIEFFGPPILQFRYLPLLLPLFLSLLTLNSLVLKSGFLGGVAYQLFN